MVVESTIDIEVPITVSNYIEIILAPILFKFLWTGKTAIKCLFESLNQSLQSLEFPRPLRGVIQ